MKTIVKVYRYIGNIGSNSVSNTLLVLSLGRKLGITSCNMPIGEKIALLANNGNKLAVSICKSNENLFTSNLITLEKYFTDSLCKIDYHLLFSKLQKGESFRLNVDLYTSNGILRSHISVSLDLIKEFYHSFGYSLDDFNTVSNELNILSFKTFIDYQVTKFIRKIVSRGIFLDLIVFSFSKKYIFNGKFISCRIVYK